MTYLEYRRERETEVSRLPIFYAYSNAQLERELTKRGFNGLDGTSEIYRIGKTGGFYLKKDAPIIREYLEKPHNSLFELMQDEKFAVEAFLYELDNHEYAINYYQGDWDVCSCFSERDLEYAEDKKYDEYLREAGYDDKVIGYFKTALAKYTKKAAAYFA